MANMRIYEAARKLNMETAELMKLLSKKGKKVKSPISVISRKDFDAILKSLTSSPPKGKSKDTKEKTRLSLVVKAGEEDEKKEPAAAVIPIGRATKETKETETEPAKPKEKTPEPQVAQPQAPAAQKPEKEKGILSYFAAGLAAVALLAVIVLNSNIQNNAVSMNKAVEGTAAMQSEMASVNSDVSLNQSMISANRDMITTNNAAISDVYRQVGDMKFGQARADLANRSDALEELAATAPQQTSSRLQKLASDLRQLASSL